MQRLGTTGQHAGPSMDGETLAFLIEKLKPSIRSTIRHLIGRKFIALDLCLTQIECQLSECDDVQSKRGIEEEVSVARALLESIQKDLGRSERRAQIDVLKPLENAASIAPLNNV